MGRGGKRPGAGAPKGNLNGFKHGRNSRQYLRLLQIIAKDPEAVDLLREIAEQRRRRTKRLRKEAEQLLLEFADRTTQARRAAEIRLYELNRSIPPPGWEDPEASLYKDPELRGQNDENFYNPIKHRT